MSTVRLNDMEYCTVTMVLMDPVKADVASRILSIKIKEDGFCFIEIGQIKILWVPLLIMPRVHNRE